MRLDYSQKNKFLVVVCFFLAVSLFRLSTVKADTNEGQHVTHSIISFDIPISGRTSLGIFDVDSGICLCIFISFSNQDQMI